MSLVQRVGRVRPAAGAKHRPAAKGRRAKGAHAAEGALSVRIVTASIFLADPSPAPLAGDRLFDVTIRPLGAGRSKAKVHVKVGPALGPLSYPPGSYRIDVAEHTSQGVFQKYPDGACEAVVHAGKSTEAVVVLASDTLREVAAACRFNVGTLLTPGDLAGPQLLTFQREFDVATAGIYWESVQPAAPPPGSPFCAPLFAEPDDTALRTALAAHGYRDGNGAFLDRLWSVYETVGTIPGIRVLPTPLSWFTTGQVPAWFQPSALPSEHLPAPHRLVADHLQTLMRYVRRLGTPVWGWVAVNELEDTADTEYWGGIPNRHGDLPVRLAEMARHYLDLAHAEDRGALLLVNDFCHEFYPPSPRGRSKKLGRAAAALRKDAFRALPFHRTMARVLKDGALRGRVGAGYQMHFAWSKPYLASPALYRGALREGIRRLRRLGARVVITEMALTLRSFFGKELYASFKPPPAWVPPAGGSAWQAWDAGRQQQYAQYGYATTNGKAWWKSQAQVFRDIVRTYLAEPECDTVVFWGLADHPEDDINDLYGHLFDSAPGGTPGVYPEGVGLPRKPAYYAVLVALVEAGYARHGGRVVPNWLRRWYPKA